MEPHVIANDAIDYRDLVPVLMQELEELDYGAHDDLQWKYTDILALIDHKYPVPYPSLAEVQWLINDITEQIRKHLPAGLVFVEDSNRGFYAIDNILQSLADHAKLIGIECSEITLDEKMYTIRCSTRKDMYAACWMMERCFYLDGVISFISDPDGINIEFLAAGSVSK